MIYLIIGGILCFLWIGWCVSIVLLTLCHIMSYAREEQSSDKDSRIILLCTFTIFIYYLYRSGIFSGAA